MIRSPIIAIETMMHNKYAIASENRREELSDIRYFHFDGCYVLCIMPYSMHIQPTTKITQRSNALHECLAPFYYIKKLLSNIRIILYHIFNQSGRREWRMSKMKSIKGLLLLVFVLILIGGILFISKPWLSPPLQNSSLYICPSGQECRLGNITTLSKGNLSTAQQKLSTDLLQEIGSDNKTENQLVYVYITTSEHADPALINSYVWNITNTDPENHLVVAWINANNLTALASLDSVQSIRTVTSPINR